MRVLYFHSLREAAGCGSEEIGDPPADVGALLEHLMERHPALLPHEPTILVARNHEWVDRASPLAPEDEVALMPPVSGG
jgi:molybdopterin converting factor subunit 1